MRGADLLFLPWPQLAQHLVVAEPSQQLPVSAALLQLSSSADLQDSHETCCHTRNFHKVAFSNPAQHSHERELVSIRFVSRIEATRRCQTAS